MVVSLTPVDKTWFEMKDIRKRRLADAVWIPLRISDHLTREGKWGYVGYKDEFYRLGSVAVPKAAREEAKRLNWSEIELGNDQRVWATGEYYKPAEIFQYHDKIDLGIALVLAQTFSTGEPNEWHLNQDLAFALGLMREGDEWVRTVEDYCVVARLRRDRQSNPIALEIRNEHLRDYLCARGMFLQTSLYRSRDIIVENTAHIGSPEEVKIIDEKEHFEIRVLPMIEGGHVGDGSYAVFNISRTDVDPDDDVPEPGRPNDENTKSQSWTGRHEGRQLVRAIGELWRDEEIDPSEKSPRVRGDNVPTGIQYIVDASGARLSSEDLDDEDTPRWLWFRPDVVPALTKHRGGDLEWYTQETGGVGCSPSERTHFGLNAAGLVTVYAYDIAKLPSWQQRVWSGYNVAPEGRVSRELLSAQMETRVANTAAPATVLPDVLALLDERFREKIGNPLFRTHTATRELVKSVSRFRALEHDGLFTLAKDLMRLIADRIDTNPLQRIVPPPQGQRWGSIKSLEKFIATLISPENARLITGPLAGAYELRVADAHLPSDELDKAYELVRVDPTAPPLIQGFRLIASVVSALLNIAEIVEDANRR
jgi:hypothetical protein